MATVTAPTLRFASLGSGSRGNGTVVECGTTRLLVDCGFSLRETRRRLGRLELEVGDLTALLVTHGHSDHINGIGVLARATGVPVWLTHGSRRECEDAAIGVLPELHHFDGDAPFAIDDIQVQPFPVPHDAREPCQFVFGDGARRLGLLTDTGTVTPHIERSLDVCDALLIECNHDRDMLANGSYPAALKERVGGPYGHLDNATAAALLERLDTSRLQHLVAMHLSEKNNQPSLARAALVQAMGCDGDWLQVADQEEGFDWLEISP
jgi:phosphoribosyl 1,2-cyclic phosphodiesterase